MKHCPRNTKFTHCDLPTKWQFSHLSGGNEKVCQEIDQVDQHMSTKFELLKRKRKLKSEMDLCDSLGSA